MILLISIQVAAFAIFLFEWLSPSGYDMTMVPPRGLAFKFFGPNFIIYLNDFQTTNFHCFGPIGWFGLYFLEQPFTSTVPKDIQPGISIIPNLCIIFNRV